MENTPQERPIDPTKTTDKPYDFEPNVEAVFSYVLGPVTGGIVLANQKTNKFVRFHAWQSTLLFGGWIVTWLLISSITPLFLRSAASVLLQLLALVLFVTWLWLMWGAYNMREPEVPVVGKIARAKAAGK